MANDIVYLELLNGNREKEKKRDKERCRNRHHRSRFLHQSHQQGFKGASIIFASLHSFFFLFPSFTPPRLSLYTLSLGPSPRLTHIPTYPMYGEGQGVSWDDVISMILLVFVSIFRGVNFSMHFVDNEAKVIHRTDGP